MDGYIKKSEAVDVIVKYPYRLAGKTATAIRMIEDLPDADVVSRAALAILTVQNMALEKAKYELKRELEKYKGVENILNENMAELITAAIDNAKKEIDTLKSLITQKEEEAYNRGYADATKEIFEEIENILYKFAYPSLTAIGTVNVLTAEGFHIRNSDYNAL